jgi:hypothetical protein
VLRPDQLDLYVILDNSLSMVWHADVCRGAPGVDPNAPAATACWGLFLGFARSLADEAKAMGTLGWQADEVRLVCGGWLAGWLAWRLTGRACRE